MARPKKLKSDAPATEVETLVHPADIARKNIPTAETAALMAEEEARAEPKLYPRNPDLDPQLVWRGKDAQDSASLRVETVPIYIQEKLYPEALIRDLQRVSAKEAAPQADLFGGFDRITDEAARLEFLPARRELVEPNDPGRQSAGDEQPGREGRPAWASADDLPRSTLRDWIRQQLATLHAKAESRRRQTV